MSNQSYTIAIFSLPPGTFVGLDLLSFNSSPNFQGITNIPPGVHFLFTGSHASLSIRNGRWLNFTPDSPRVHGYKWNRDLEALESLKPEQVSGGGEFHRAPHLSSQNAIDYGALQDATAEIAIQTPSLADDHDTHPAESDRSLEGDSTDWPRLTSYISSNVLTRILSPDWELSSASTAPNDTETIPGLSHLEVDNVLHELPFNVLPIDLKQTWDAADIGRTRTERARDRSWYLGRLIEMATSSSAHGNRTVGATEVLGEFQFCFLMTLTLANYSGLEQWKRLLGIFLTCQAALEEAEAYFVEMLKILRLQILHVEDVEGGLFDLKDETASSWLRLLWGRFRAKVDDGFPEATVAGTPRPGDTLKREANATQSLLERKYAWQSERDILRRGFVELEDGERVEVSMPGVDEDEETGEYAPVVVEQ